MNQQVNEEEDFIDENRHEKNVLLEATKVLWIEKLFVWIVFIEKNILLPCTYLGALSYSAPIVINRFGLL